jgi:hypothetical protein
MSHSKAKDKVALKTIGNYTEDGNLGFSLGLGFHSKARLLHQIPVEPWKLGGKQAPWFHHFLTHDQKGLANGQTGWVGQNQHLSFPYEQRCTYNPMPVCSMNLGIEKNL